MINELYELSQSLSRHGLLEATTHPDITNVGKSNCVVIELDDGGIPRGVRYLQKQQTAALWKHSKGNHHSFPAIRLRHPLLSRSQSGKIEDAVWERADITQRTKILKGLDYSAINPECQEVHISDWTIQQLKPVLDSSVPELVALGKLVSIFPQIDCSVNFLQEIVELVKNSIICCQNGEILEFFRKMLAGVKETKKGKVTYKCDCMTYYDLVPSDDYKNLVASKETQQALIKALNDLMTQETAERDIISPLSGVKVVSQGDKYPNPNIPLLGLTYLYSKKSDIPCLTRYAKAGVAAFQTGKHEIARINDALAFLTQDTRKNKTWRAMSDSNRDKPDLLLAYLPADPQNNAFLAKILCDPSGYDDLGAFRDTAEPIYEALCQQVLGSVEQVLQKNSQATVNVLLLETLDPGRKQVVYETSFTAERLCENLLVWSSASRNLPLITFRYWKAKEIKEVFPICPGPMAICQLLKNVYTRSSSFKPMKSSAASLHQIYSLYMPAVNADRSEALLDRFLEQTMRSSMLLLGDIGCKMILEYALPSEKQTRMLIESAAKFTSLLAILLYFKGIGKETYMSNAAFNVGQFLKLSDLLHKEYCIQVRNGGDKSKTLPSQLMGNEMLTIAAETPIEGLNRLRERMKIYLAWANTATGENVGLAKWILARFEEVSLKIAEHELPEHFNPTDQAQVLIGYLAAISYEKKDKTGIEHEEDKS